MSEDFVILKVKDLNCTINKEWTLIQKDYTWNEGLDSLTDEAEEEGLWNLEGFWSLRNKTLYIVSISTSKFGKKRTPETSASTRRSRWSNIVVKPKKSDKLSCPFREGNNSVKKACTIVGE
ncbi:hypothetical protein CBL_11365 [Carabus blaptoides fortunei]